MTLYNIAFLSLILITPVILYKMAPVLLKEGKMSRKKWLYIVSHALFLSIITIIIFNQPDSITTNQDEIVSLLKNTSVNEKSKADQFLKNNFILINNSHDQAIIKYSGQESGSSSVIAITNRQHLTNVINWCSVNSEVIDMVVCDIGFKIPDKNGDYNLLKSFRKLAGMRKLLASQSDTHNLIIDSLPESSKGMVNEKTSEDRFNTHQVYRSGHYSLAYKVYSLIDTVSPRWGNSLLFFEKSKKLGNSLRMNNFLPFLYIAHDDFHWLNATGSDKKQGKDNDGFTIGHTRLFHNLENLATDSAEKRSLYMDLLKRKTEGLKNILFIGAFEGDADVHHTLFGELRGAVILLNLVYNLHIGTNIISLQLFFLLFLGYLLITSLLIYGVKRALAEDWAPKATPALVYKWLKRKQTENKYTIGLMIELFKEHIYWLALAVVIVSIYFLTGVLINIAGLLFYFLMFRLFLMHFGKHEQKIAKKHR